MIESGFHHALKFRNYPLGQYFAQLDAPLIERVDVPNDTLRKDVVLVERDELSEVLGRQSLG